MYLELHVPNFDVVREFYSKLGFVIVWEREPEEYKGYLVMKKDADVICFWGGNEDIYTHEYFGKYSPETPRGYGVELVLQIADLETYYKQVQTFAEVVEPLQMKPWGLQDFRIIDPLGYYIRITSPHDILDERYAVK